jgi:hypothetical protein
MAAPCAALDLRSWQKYFTVVVYCRSRQTDRYRVLDRRTSNSNGAMQSATKQQVVRYYEPVQYSSPVRVVLNSGYVNKYSRSNNMILLTFTDRDNCFKTANNIRLQ